MNNGPIKRSRAHSSGTIVEVWRSEDFGDEQSAPWITVCEHASICEHDSRALAIAWSALPEIRCETGCRHFAYQRAGCATCRGKLQWADDAWICTKCGDEFACPCYDCSYDNGGMIMATQRTPEEVIEMLASALLRTEVNFKAAVRGLPVRDMTETLAENTAALDAVIDLSKDKDHG